MIIKRQLPYLILGLGIGIILTNLIYYFNPYVEYKELSDEDVIERATELGMVFIKDAIDMENSKENEEGLIDSESTDSDKENDEIEEEEIEEIIFKINEGESLVTISKNLFDAGLIDDVDEFIKYAKEREVDKKFRVGTYKLNKGMDYETVVDILTKKIIN